MNKKQIAQEIMYDVETGVYNRFKKLKARLVHIASQLVLSSYITNRDITEGEKKTLIENDYI